MEPPKISIDPYKSAILGYQKEDKGWFCLTITLAKPLPGQQPCHTVKEH